MNVRFSSRPLCFGSLVLACLFTTGCGLGGGGNDLSGNARLKANSCAPDNPYARAGGRLLSGYQDGTRSDEKQWLASYMDQQYLWYQEIPDVDPGGASFNTGSHLQLMSAYFQALKSQAKTGDRLKDHHSFLEATADYTQRTQAGVEVGYGVEWATLAADPPRDIRIAYVQPGSNGAQVGLLRGDRLLSVEVEGREFSVDDPSAAAVALLRQVTRPTVSGQAAALQVRRADGTARQVTVTASPTVAQPVLVSKVLGGATTPTGYLMLVNFDAPAEAPLVDAFRQFSSEGVRDLVLDLRYNGGGYLYLASELAFMIAGEARTRSQVFTRLAYNDKRSSDNFDIPFERVTSGESGSNVAGGQALPTLNLSRVTVLATDETCSASEALVNGLRGVGVTVNLVGSTTCGKPYGFTAKDNCGLTYLPVEFQSVNARGEGDYAGGMPVQCEANDDLSQPLGETTEGMLAAALSFRATASCPAKKSAVAVTGPRLDRLQSERGMIIRPRDRRQ